MYASVSAFAIAGGKLQLDSLRTPRQPAPSGRDRQTDGRGVEISGKRERKESASKQPKQGRLKEPFYSFSGLSGA